MAPHGPAATHTPGVPLGCTHTLVHHKPPGWQPAKTPGAPLLLPTSHRHLFWAGSGLSRRGQWAFAHLGPHFASLAALGGPFSSWENLSWPKRGGSPRASPEEGLNPHLPMAESSPGCKEGIWHPCSPSWKKEKGSTAPPCSSLWASHDDACKNHLIQGAK